MNRTSKLDMSDIQETVDTRKNYLGTLFVISAPSGAGKTSLVGRCLKDNPHLSVSVSHTTRPPRAGEVDGINYYFVDKTSFEQMVNEGKFLESATVFDNFYGTSQQEVESWLKVGKDLILEIDWQFKNVICIFILPPSLAVLKQRLKNRGQDGESVIARRLADAQEEISHYVEFDYLVINDDFEVAAKELNAIFLNNLVLKKAKQLQTQELISNLLKPSA
jgi:guanylate kinase